MIFSVNSRYFDNSYSRYFDGLYSRYFDGFYSRYFDGFYSRYFDGLYSRYFDDPWQHLPKNGYTAMFENMLLKNDKITVRLSTDYFK